MARKGIATDQIVKLIVGSGKASPSPPVGPALGSKGVKSMDFCKVQFLLFVLYLANPEQEFNARTAHMEPGTPIPVRVTVRPDRSFHFEMRTPTTTWLLFQAAGIKARKNRLRGSTMAGSEIIGTVSLKHVYNIAQLKQSENRLSGLSLQGLCKSVIAAAKSVGIEVIS